MKIVLFQPRYPHGSKRQIYLPGGLMNLGSRFLDVGLEVEIIDLNFSYLGSHLTENHIEGCDVAGFSILGPPFIPGVVRSIETLREKGFSQKVILGGEGISRVSEIDFEAWFGRLGNVHQMRSDREIEMALGISTGSLPSAYETSMSSMLQRLPMDLLRKYLANEFCLFLSNGCAYNCNFCAALKGQKEQYRSLDALKDEVRFICDHLRRMGQRRLRAYLSNLDIFQTPPNLERCLKSIHAIGDEYGIELYLRGLATSRSTVLASRKDPWLPSRLRTYGLHTVGFGADGADEETWRRENKMHNSLSEIEAVLKIMRAADITPELLMVIGFQYDRPKALLADLRFSFTQGIKGALIRPYLGKSKTPSGRWEEDDQEVQVFRNDASLLSLLDYAMLGSPATHPYRFTRYLANLTYLLIIIILSPFGKCSTRPLLPVSRSGPWRWVAHFFNHLMPFDR